MQPWQQILIGAVLLALIAWVPAALERTRERKYRDAARKLELVLQPRETIRVICPQKKGRVILTSKRVLFDTPQGFHAVPVRTIQKVQGTNEKGNRTTLPANMVSLTIKADQEHIIQNSCEEFGEFAKQLIKKTAKKKPNRRTGS